MSAATGQSPASSRGRTTAVARVAASCRRYLNPVQKLSAPGAAAPREATPSTDWPGSPESSSPKRTAISPSVMAMPALPSRDPRSGLGGRSRGGRRLGLDRGDELRRDVDAIGREQHALAQHQLEAVRAGVGLHFLQQRALHLADFLVAAQVEVFLQLLEATVDVELEVAHFALGADAVGLGHHGRFFLQLVGLLLQRLLLRRDVALARHELGLEGRLRRLRLWRLLEQPAEVDEPDLESLRTGARRGHERRCDQQRTENVLSGHVSFRLGYQNAEPIVNWKRSTSSSYRMPSPLNSFSGKP